MAIGITVITTANSARRFLQTDEAAIEQTLDSLRRSSQMFAGKPLIVGSEAQTEVFARASIACLEFAAAKDLSAYVASPLNLQLTVLTPEQLAEPFSGWFEGERFKVRIDFFFTGGHVLHTLAEGVRKAALRRAPDESDQLPRPSGDELPAGARRRRTDESGHHHALRDFPGD
jgi:hypothetical protein